MSAALPEIYNILCTYSISNFHRQTNSQPLHTLKLELSVLISYNTLTQCINFFNAFVNVLMTHHKYC